MTRLRETYLINDEVANPTDVNEFLVDEFASDVVARKLHAKLLHDGQFFASYLRAND